MRLRTLLVGITVLAMMLAPVGSADARKKRKKVNSYSTTLTIDQAAGNTIRGDLSSTKDVCVEDRVVRVTRGNAVAVGSATTDGNGSWSINTNPVLAHNEQVTARVDKATISKKKKKKTTCGADSDTITVGDGTGGTNQTLNVQARGANGGTGRVTSSPAGIDCPGGSTAPPNDCTDSYLTGTDVTLTAASGANSVFDGWTGCDSTNGNQCVVDMNRTRNVAAVFNSTGGPGTPPPAPAACALNPIPVAGPVLCAVLDALGT